jgi:hypothetical protein
MAGYLIAARGARSSLKFRNGRSGGGQLRTLGFNFEMPRPGEPPSQGRRHNFAFSLNALPRGKPTRFFVGRHWYKAQRLRILEGRHVAPARLNGANPLKSAFWTERPGKKGQCSEGCYVRGRCQR